MTATIPGNCNQYAYLGKSIIYCTLTRDHPGEHNANRWSWHSPIAEVARCDHWLYGQQCGGMAEHDGDHQVMKEDDIGQLLDIRWRKS